MRKWAILALILAAGVGLAANGTGRTPVVALQPGQMGPGDLMQLKLTDPGRYQQVLAEQLRQAPPPQPGQLDYARGPDADGWRYLDNRETGGPTYSWDTYYTTSQTGDDSYWMFDWGWNFAYRGTNYTGAYVYCNGYITFGSVGTSYYPDTFPSPSNNSNMVAGFAYDLYCDGTGYLRYGTYGSAPNRKAVITWDNIRYYSSNGERFSFQLILSESDGSITAQYATHSTSWQYYTSVRSGMQNSNGTVGLNYPNPEIANSRAVKYSKPSFQYNVGVTGISSPPSVCSLGTYTPAASVKNMGTSAQPSSFYVKYRATGAGTYTDSTLVPSGLAAGRETTITFTPWTISTKGAYTVACSTKSAADSSRSDDKYTKTVKAGLLRVLLLTADYPTNVWAVACSLMNRFPEDFIIDTMDVGYYYQRSAPNVDTLLARKYKCVWTWGNYSYMNGVACGDSLAKFLERGGGGCIWSPFASYDLGRFSSVYTPVAYPVNGVYSSVTLGTVFLPGHKIMEGVSSFGATYYSGDATTLTHTTAYKVSNFSNSNILAACNDTAGRRTALVDVWPVAMTYGYYSGDYLRLMRNAIIWVSQNDDVGVTKLEAPTGIVDSGASVTPACSTYNFGNQTETYQVRMKIGSTYDESTLVTSQAPGAYNYVTFPSWTATARGNAAVSCSTRLAIDGRMGNDKLTGTAFVRVQDVGVTTLTVPLPGASYKYDTAITPKATWRNYGNVAAVNFEAWMLLSNSADGRVYSKKVVVPSLAVGGSIEVGTFPRCTLRMGGAWTSRCSTYLATDVKFANDTLNRAFTVTGGAPPPPPTTWVTKNPMPAGAKAIKNGGWLAYDAGSSDGTGRIYAARGNKQPDFWAYAPLGDSWGLRAPWQPGVEGKLPYNGSAGCADGNGVIYATKGNNKSGFWKYDAAANAWTQKKDVPLGVSNKKVKGGTDIVWAYKGLVGSPYLLKGYKNEFYRYDTGADSWQVLTPAPVGANLKYDKGSWLAYDGVKTIYAFKAKYHEFYSYNTETDSWNPTALLPMPIPGSAGSKKAKEGSCGTYVGGAINSIYALKGGNTREFWKYTVATNAWAEKETIPTGLLKKKVKAGADIVAAGLSVYATKGNKSNEFWMYVPSGMVFEAPRHDGALAGKTAIAQGMSISPNPLATGFAVLRYGLPRAGAAQVSVYNVTGQTVMAQTLAAGRSGIVNLDLRHLGNGVYLVKLSSEGYVNSQKLVVQR